MPGKTYAFGAAYRARDVVAPSRSVLARLVWLDAAGETMRPMEYPLVGPVRSDGWTPVAGAYRAPDTAARARLELHLRWTATGEVLWRDAAFEEATLPQPRRVTLAAVNHRPRGTTSPQDSRERFVRGSSRRRPRRGPTSCACPRGSLSPATGTTYIEVAEPVPRRDHRFLGSPARRLHECIVAGIEKGPEPDYNTAVLIGRDGPLVGQYRKTSLPYEEIEGGVTPGADMPVFDIDFGRVGLMICWDSRYPEVAHAARPRGVEVILMPIAGGVEALVHARAIENQVLRRRQRLLLPNRHLRPEGRAHRPGKGRPRSRRG